MKRNALVLDVLLAAQLSDCTITKPICKAQAMKWPEGIDLQVTEYEGVEKLAFSSTVLDLVEPVKTMQAMKREIEASKAS